MTFLFANDFNNGMRSKLMQLIDVVAAVISRRGHYLICQRPNEKAHGGLWEFPGGKVNPNETFDQALARELLEELGLQSITVGPELYQGGEPGSRYRIRFFEVTAEGEPILHEHDALAWQPIDQLAQYPLAPVDTAFITHWRSTIGHTV
jgi:8-oxo-dGTP diphosphatase